MEERKIVATRKNEEGDLLKFKLDNGEILNYDEAVARIQRGGIANVDLYRRYGREIIRSEADGDKFNNLDNLPTF